MLFLRTFNISLKWTTLSILKKFSTDKIKKPWNNQDSFSSFRKQETKDKKGAKYFL